MFETPGQNYYEILDIKPDASQNEIRQAYLRLKSAYSKDSAALYSLFDEHETNHILGRVEEAFVILSSPEKRKEYDKTHGFLKPSDHAAFLLKASTNPSFRPNIMPTTSPKLETVSIVKSQPPVTKPAALYHESRLGIVKRLDLAKPYAQHPQTEEELAREAEFHGSFFKKVREYKNITVEELSEFTKISKTYILCIESEEFESLPAPVYLRGFIVQISKALKLPWEKAASTYMTHYKNSISK